MDDIDRRIVAALERDARRVDLRHSHRAAEQLARPAGAAACHPEVRHMALLGGEFDVMLLVRTAGNDALRHAVLEQLQAIPGVIATRTFLIFEDVENVPG